MGKGNAKLVLVAASIVGFCLLVCIGSGYLLVRRTVEREAAKSANMDALKAKHAAEAEAQFKAMSPVQHLEAVKASPLGPDHMKHLDAIPGATKEYLEAWEIINKAEAEKQGEQLERGEQARRLYAEKLEQVFLSTARMDTSCSTEGKYGEILVVKYALMGRVMANDFCGRSDFVTPIKDLGFAKIIFKNSIDGQQWVCSF